MSAVWFHVMIGTYGSWLYGDPRGFRTRHHREHVEGDYKEPPPPGRYTEAQHRSEESLKHEPVVLSREARRVVGEAVRDRLQMHGAFVLCIAVASKHLHALVKVPRSRVRQWCGDAKRHAWFEMRAKGWNRKLWAKRGKALPIKDRGHQLNVYRYILNHRKQGAWVWSWVEEQRGKRKA